MQMAPYLARTVYRYRWPKLSIRSVTSVRAVRTKRSAQAFARSRASAGFPTAVMPVLARTASKELVNCPAPVADQEPQVRGAIDQVHHEVADLLGGPRTVQIGGVPEDMHVAVCARP